MIYEYFRVTGANDSVENYADLFTVGLRNQEFDSKLDGILLSMTKNPPDDILEGLYKLRIRESKKLKTVLELYDLEIHQKRIGPDYHRLRTMVKRSIETSVFPTCPRSWRNAKPFSGNAEQVGDWESVRNERRGGVLGSVHRRSPQEASVRSRASTSVHLQTWRWRKPHSVRSWRRFRDSGLTETMQTVCLKKEGGGSKREELLAWRRKK